ncbi:hypothetical protein [Scopulibacillus cellulosilyticus]|uniref:Uncharacterized protein n=1 Tax=Scopulibacillus cellulosilyticus TaxID=2665665 RepID=A0ABW2Q308_9BACL
MSFQDPINKSDNQAIVSRSGNSDVDVTVIVDTTAIAYAMACMMHANGTLNNNQFNHMLKNLDKLIKGKKNRLSKDDSFKSNTEKPWIRPVRSF